MKYFYLLPKSQRNNFFAYHMIDDNGYLTARSSYRSLSCPLCNKIDEESAFHLEFEEDIDFQTRADFFETNDGVFCVSARTRKIFDRSAVKGILYKSMGKQEKYFACWPSCLAPTDTKTAGYEFHEPLCEHCGRYREVNVFPRISSIVVPPEATTVFAPDTWLENRHGKVTVFIASQTVVDIIKLSCLKGLEFVRAG